MRLPLKKHLATLVRVRNPDKSRWGYLRLDKNENIIALPAALISKFRRQLTSDFISSYPLPGRLYRKLAQHVGCQPENLYLSPGSDGAIKSVFEAFVEPGDKVLLVGPTYAMFYVYTKMFQAELVEIKYAADLSLSVEKILSPMESERPKLVCIANPNSPTGTVIEPADLLSVIESAGQKNAVILIDEAYYPFYPRTCSGLINQYPHLVVTRTLSKAFGLASGRLGFAIGSQDMVDCLFKTRPMYETNAFAAGFAEILLDHIKVVRDNIKEVNKGKAYLKGQLREMGLPYFKSYTNFILIDLGSRQKAGRVARALEMKKILVKAGFNTAPLDRCIRVNIGNIRQMEKFLRTLGEVIEVSP